MLCSCASAAFLFVLLALQINQSDVGKEKKESKTKDFLNDFTFFSTKDKETNSHNSLMGVPAAAPAVPLPSLSSFPPFLFPLARAPKTKDPSPRCFLPSRIFVLVPLYSFFFASSFLSFVYHGGSPLFIMHGSDSLFLFGSAWLCWRRRPRLPSSLNIVVFFPVPLSHGRTGLWFLVGGSILVG